MAKRFLVVLRHAPYGRLDAAEAVRHLNGAVANDLEAAALLLDDGIYLARTGQMPAAGWRELSAAHTPALRPSTVVVFRSAAGARRRSAPCDWLRPRRCTDVP